MEKRPALGKGLSALIPDAPEPPRTSPVELDIDRLTPNSYQPRGQFDDARLEDLARSIRSNGVIQPIVVRRVGDNFHIIAGERRWRAAQKAGLLKVPVVVRDVKEGNDRAVLEMALIENIQREDLNPIEEAVAYRRLADDYQLTQEQIADAVGKDRSSIANYVRLLRLPQEVRANVASNAISMGHARALLALPDEAAQLRVARDIVAKQLSVRDVETLVRKTEEGKTAPKEATKADVHTRIAEDKLRLALGTRVRINRRGKGGRIEIDFVNEDELQRLYELLTDAAKG